MAKGRFVSQETIEDARIERLSELSFMLYTATIPYLDKDGLIDGRPWWVAGHIIPSRTALHDRVGQLLEEWVTVGLVTRYDGPNGPVLFFHNFRRDNANLSYGKEADSRHPPPPGFKRVDDIGLIPTDPELAGRMIDSFDKRSTYRAALAEAAKQTIESGKTIVHLVDDIDLTDLHKKLVTYSRPTRDVVASKSRAGHEEHQDQDQHQLEVEVKNTTTNLLLEFALVLADGVDGWNGAEAFCRKTAQSGGGGDGLLCLISWLYLYEGVNQSDPYQSFDFSSAYGSKPFAGIDNVVGYIIRQVERGIMPKLHDRHRADLQAELAERQSATG
jgi:hypothetical protein